MAPAAGSDELGNHVTTCAGRQFVTSGVRQRGHSARIPNPSDDLGQRRPVGGEMRGLAFTKIFAKRIVGAGHMAASHHGRGEVRPRWQAGLCVDRGLQLISRQSQLAEPRAHIAHALPPPLGLRLQALLKLR